MSWPDAGPPAGSLPIPASCDAFFGGRFHLLQPKSGGFRAGLDALLLAASLPASRRGACADLGAGAGAAAFAALVRCAHLDIVLAERDPVMLALARASIALPENARLAARMRVAELDVLGRRTAREAAGLPDSGFGTVITNPPFHPAGGRQSPDPLRAAARAIPAPGFLAGWIRTAAALLEHGGLFAMIARPDALGPIIEAAGNRLGDLRIKPVHAAEGRPAIRILVHARKGSRAPLSLLAPLVLHGEDGAPTPLADRVALGEAAIDLGLA